MNKEKEIISSQNTEDEVRLTSKDFKDSFSQLKSVLSPIENGFIKTIVDIIGKYGIEIEFNYFDGDVSSKYISSNMVKSISNKILTDPSKVIGLFYKNGSMIPDSNYRNTNRNPRLVKVHNIIDDGTGNVSDESYSVTKTAINVQVTYDVHILCMTRKLTELLEFIYYTEIMKTKAMNLVYRVKGVEIPFTYLLKFEEISNDTVMSSDLNSNVYDISFGLQINGVVLNPYSVIDNKVSRAPLWGLELNTVGFFHNNDGDINKERVIESPDELLEEVPLLSYDESLEYVEIDNYKENIDGSKITRIYSDRIEVQDGELYSIYYKDYSIAYNGNKSTTYKKNGNLTVEKVDDKNSIISFNSEKKKYIKKDNKYTEYNENNIIIKKDGFTFTKVKNSNGEEMNLVVNKSGSKYYTKGNTFKLRDIDRNLYDTEIKDYYEKYNQDIEVWMTNNSNEIDADTSVLVFKV